MASSARMWEIEICVNYWKFTSDIRYSTITIFFPKSLTRASDLKRSIPLLENFLLFHWKVSFVIYFYGNGTYLILNIYVQSHWNTFWLQIDKRQIRAIPNFHNEQILNWNSFLFLKRPGSGIGGLGRFRPIVSGR